MPDTNTSELGSEKKSIRIFGSLQARTHGMAIFEPKIRKIFEQKDIKIHWEVMTYLEHTPVTTGDTIVLAEKSSVAAVYGNGVQSLYQREVIRPLSCSEGTPLGNNNRLCTDTDLESIHRNKIGMESGTKDKNSKNDDMRVPLGVMRGEEMDVDGTENPIKFSRRYGDKHPLYNPTTSIHHSGVSGLPLCIYDAPQSHPVVIASNLPCDRIDAYNRALARAEALRRINSENPTSNNPDMTNGTSREDVDGIICADHLSGITQIVREPALTLPLSIHLVIYATKAPSMGSDDSPVDTSTTNKYPIVQKTVSVSSLEAISVKAAEIKVSITTEDIRVILGSENGRIQDDTAGDAGELDYGDRTRDEAKECSDMAHNSANSSPVYDKGEGNTSCNTDVYEHGNQDDNEKSDLLCGYAEVHVSFVDLSSAVIPVVSVRPDTNVNATVELLRGDLLSDNVNKSNIKSQIVATDFIYAMNFLPLKSFWNLNDEGGHRRRTNASSSNTVCNKKVTYVGLSVKKWPKSPVVVPYGCMPLDELYSHFVTFFTIAMGEGIEISPGKTSSRNDNSTNGSTTAESIKCSRKGTYICNSLMKQLRILSRGASTTNISCSPALSRDPLTGQYRWDSVQSISLLQYILGDKKVLPVLSMLMCCKGLEHIDLEQNALSGISMKRIQECLKVHPSVKSIVLKGNNFYESAGEEILRLLKNNTRIVVCDIGSGVPPRTAGSFTVSGISNIIHFSEKLKKRIEHHANNVNHDSLQQDGFNFLSQDYAYLNNAEDIPAEAWYCVQRVWGILSAYPGTQSATHKDKDNNNIIVIDTNIINGGFNTVDGEGCSNIRATHHVSGTLPKCTAAPLFAEAMRNVQIEMQMNGPEDRIIQGVFRDYSRAAVAANSCAVDAVCKDDGGNIPKASDAVYKDEADGAAGLQLQARVRRAVQCGIISSSNEASMQPCYFYSYSRMVVLPMEVTLQALSRSQWCKSGSPPNKSTDLSASFHFMSEGYSRDRWSYCVMALQALGHVHYSMGIRPQHYMHANEAFVEWMEKVLGPRLFDKMTRVAFIQVLALVSRSVISGTPLAIHTIAVI